MLLFKSIILCILINVRQSICFSNKILNHETRNKNQDPVSFPKLMVISLDGFGHGYLEPNLTPNMYRLATQKGVLGHMLSTFSTKTLPNHHSISTGLYQEMHGIVHNHMYDPMFEEYFEDGQPTDNKWWDNLLATPIYIANQLFDSGRSSCCSPWIGCHARYFGQCQTRYFQRFNQSSSYYERLEWTITNMLRPERPANLAMMYNYEPDNTGHRYGPYGRQTLQKVKELDRFINHLEQRLLETNLSTNVNVIILSDHGLCEIDPKKVLILDQILNRTWFEAYGSNPVYCISIRSGFEQIVYRILKQHSQKFPIDVYRRWEIPKRFHYNNHRRIHGLLVVAHEGYSIHATFAEWLKEKHKLGQHGYDNHALSMRPLFMAFGPSFKQAYKHTRPFINVDLYPLMLQLLNIPNDQYFHQGNLTNVIDMLSKPKI